MAKRLFLYVVTENADKAKFNCKLRTTRTPIHEIQHTKVPRRFIDGQLEVGTHEGQIAD